MKLFAWIVPASLLTAMLALYVRRHRRCEDARAGGIGDVHRPHRRSARHRSRRRQRRTSPKCRSRGLAGVSRRDRRRRRRALLAARRDRRARAAARRARFRRSSARRAAAARRSPCSSRGCCDAGAARRSAASSSRSPTPSASRSVSSKAAILQDYVNRVPMGGNLYGVEAAARTYFGEPAADLDLAQASLLAAIPNDPARLAPDDDWAALRARQRFILTAWRRSREITPHGGRPRLRRDARTCAGTNRASPARRTRSSFSPAIRLAPAAACARRSTRSCSASLQAQTEDVVGALASYHVSDGAALVVDNRTGDVLAYVGSPDYFSAGLLGSNDGVQALRQPGSSLKPFTYELALERGTISLDDDPVGRARGVRAARRTALPARRLQRPLQRPGARALRAGELAQRSGGARALVARRRERCSSDCTSSASRISNRPASYYGLGLTLGSGEVSLWELVRAYAAIARGGDVVPLALVADTRARSPCASASAPTGSWSPTCSPIRTRARSRSGSTRCSRCRFPLR